MQRRIPLPSLVRSVLLCAALAASTLSLAAAGEKAAGKTNASATLSLAITAGHGTNEIELRILLPRDIPGQQTIREIRYTRQPDQVLDIDGNRYGYFLLKSPPAQMTLSVTVLAELSRYDYATAIAGEQVRQLEKPDALKTWLKPEKYLECDDPGLVAIARKLSAADPENTLRKCFLYVLKTMKGRPYDPEDRGALWALKNKKGDCTDFSDLFVALCRANGIPARFCEGILVERTSDTQKHDWAEAYLEKYGWIPFDPYLAFNKSDTTFERMKPVYLKYETLRSDATLNGYHFWSYMSRGNGQVTMRDTFKIGK